MVEPNGPRYETSRMAVFAGEFRPRDGGSLHCGKEAPSPSAACAPSQACRIGWLRTGDPLPGSA